MYRSKVCVHEFSFFVSGLDNQLEPLENNNPVRKKNLLQVSLHLLLHLSLTQAHGILRFPCLHFAAAGSLHILGSSRFEVLCTCNARSSSTWLLACPLCAFTNHDCLSFPAPCSLSAAPCQQQPTADLALHTSSTLPARGSLRQAICLQKAGEIRRVMYHFKQLIRTNALVVKVSSSEFGDLGFDSWWVLKRSAAPRPFCVALSPSGHWHAFYIAALSIFSFLDFVSGDLALTES